MERCAICNNTRVHGRTVVHETFRVDEIVSDMINQGKDENVLRDHLIKNASFMTLSENARALAETGETTIEEALRVVHFVEG